MYVVLLGNIMHLCVHRFNLQLSLYYVARGFTLSFERIIRYLWILFLYHQS